MAEKIIPNNFGIIFSVAKGIIIIWKYNEKSCTRQNLHSTNRFVAKKLQEGILISWAYSKPHKVLIY